MNMAGGRSVTKLMEHGVGRQNMGGDDLWVNRPLGYLFSLTHLKPYQIRRVMIQVLRERKIPRVV